MTQATTDDMWIRRLGTRIRECGDLAGQDAVNRVTFPADEK
jgi:hypothetical protein